MVGGGAPCLDGLGALPVKQLTPPGEYLWRVADIYQDSQSNEQ